MMRTLLAFFLFSLVGFSQQTSTTPDLTRTDVFNATNFGGTCSTTGGTTLTVPDGDPYSTYRVSFYVDGVSATAASVGIQGAPNNAGSPGTWTTTGLTALEGANPITSGAQGTVVVRGFFKFIRIFCSGVTGSLGSVTATIVGYRGTSPALAAGSGGVASNVNVQQIAGVATASDSNGGQVPGGVSTTLGDGVSDTQVVFQADNAGTPTIGANRTFLMNFNGTTWDRNFVCTTSVQVALSGTAYTQIIAGSNVLRLCKVFVTSVSGGNPVVNTFNFAFGTCAGTPTQIFTAGGVTGIDEDFGGALRSGSGQAFCVKESVANSDLVTVTYTPGY